MGYARLEAEGLIVGTQEWKQRQTEKANEELQQFHIQEKKREEERMKRMKRCIEDMLARIGG